MAKTFNERIDEILDNNDIRGREVYETVEKAMNLLPQYGIDSEKLLSNLENIQGISSSYGRYDERRNKLPAASFVEVDDHGYAVSPITQIEKRGILNQNLFLDESRQAVDLSEGIIDCLSVQKKYYDYPNDTAYYEMGMGRSLSGIGNCIREQLAEEITPNKQILGHYIFETPESQLKNKYFDLLMQIDGKNLVSNYFDLKDEFKYDTSVIELNKALDDVKVKYPDNPKEIDAFKIISADGEVGKDDWYFMRSDIDTLNKAFCQYAGSKLQEMSKEDAEFYKLQIMSLPDMNSEHLRILENPKDTSVDMNVIFEQNITKILDVKEDKNVFDLSEVNAITDAMKKLKDMGVNEEVLLDNLKKIEEIRYINKDKMIKREQECAEFSKTDFRGRSKDDAVQINIGINVSDSAFPTLKHIEVASVNRDFAYGIVDALAVKESEEKGGLFKDKSTYTMGINEHFPDLNHYVKDYLAKSVFESDVRLFTVFDKSYSNSNFSNEFIDFKEHNLSKHFEFLLENDGGNLIKNYFENNESFVSDPFVRKLENALVNDHYMPGYEFRNAFCEYLGEHSKHLSNEDYEFMRNRLDSLPNIEERDLQAMDHVRSNVLDKDKEIESVNIADKEVVFE